MPITSVSSDNIGDSMTRHDIRLTHLVAFLLAGILTLFTVTLIMTYKSSRYADVTREQLDTEHLLGAQLNDAVSDLRRARLALYRATATAIAGDQETTRKAISIVHDLTQHANDTVQSFRKLNNGRSGIDEAALQQAFDDYQQYLITPAISAATAGDSKGINAAAAKGLPYDQALTQQLNATHATINMRQNDAHQLMDRLERRNTLMMVVCFIAMLGLCSAIYTILRHQIIAPLRRMQWHFDHIADNDLSHTIVSQGKNEIGQLLSSLAHMQDNLRGVVTRVHANSDVLHDNVNTIHQDNAALAERTEQQSAAIAQTAQHMDTLTTIVKQNSEHATQAKQRSQEVTYSAEQGGKEVQSMAHEINDIAHMAKQITSITTMIDSLAFQTNLIALNASVEAARAGEHGRSFAVVAEEVRNLSTRSTKSAYEIATLITAINDKIHAGSQRASDAGTTMTHVIAGVHEVNTLIEQITLATQEQHHSITHTHHAFNDINQSLQDNARMVDDVARSTDALRKQSSELTTLVSNFSLPEASPSDS